MPARGQRHSEQHWPGPPLADQLAGQRKPAVCELSAYAGQSNRASLAERRTHILCDTEAAASARPYQSGPQHMAARSRNLPMMVGSSSRWRLLAGMIARPRATCKDGGNSSSTVQPGSCRIRLTGLPAYHSSSVDTSCWHCTCEVCGTQGHQETLMVTWSSSVSWCVVM